MNRDENKPATLSLCMIVKNEERFLDGCLASVREVVDQMIIVDTGSTDKTRHIATEWEAQVIEFDWCDDFSAARNVSIGQATGDWILWMDADERLRPECINELKSLLKPHTKAVAYNLHIASRVEDGKGTHLSGAHRLFTNGHGIRFSGRIHEQITHSLVAAGGEERFSDIVIDHLGYDQAEVDQSTKAQRNLRLLKRMVKEQPNSGYAHYTLAQQYGLLNRHQKAYKHFKIAYRLNQFAAPMRASLLNTMAESCYKLQRQSEALRLCQQSLKLMPEQVGAYLLQYRMALGDEREEEAMRILQKMAEMNSLLKKEGKRISTDVTIPAHKLEYEFAHRYLAAGNNRQAIASYQRALRDQPEQMAIHHEISRVLLDEERYEEAEEHLIILFEASPGDPASTENLGKVLIRQHKFNEAIEIYQQLLAVDPANQIAVRRLVGLYAKTGNRTRADEMVKLLGG